MKPIPCGTVQATKNQEFLTGTGEGRLPVQGHSSLDCNHCPVLFQQTPQHRTDHWLLLQHNLRSIEGLVSRNKCL